MPESVRTPTRSAPRAWHEGVRRARNLTPAGPSVRRAGVSLLLALTLAGCATGTVTPDPAATALIDRENGRIVLPLDGYAPSAADEAVMTQARLAILRSCLQPKGYNGVKPPPSTTTRILEERPYGLWLVERAKANGFEPPPAEVAMETTPPPGGWSDESDPGLNEAYTGCAAEVQGRMADVSPPGGGPQVGVATGLEGQASALARQDAEWTRARDEWRQCLRQSGLTPPEDESSWSAREVETLTQDGAAAASAAAKREEIRLAVIHATCNERTDLTQRLGDLEAGYQAALMKGHEAALEEEKRLTTEHLDAARVYLAGHQ